MNVTLQTSRFNPQQNNLYQNNKANNPLKAYSNTQPSFGSISVPGKSKLLAPFNNAMDKFTDWIAKNYTAKIYESKFAEYLAKKTENLGSVVGHMQVLGSVIISGMYMTQTLRNKQLDEERKKTLAVNQGLTFVVSTFLSYLIDKKIDNKWEKLTAKYAASRSGEPKILEKLAEYNEKCKKEAEAAGITFKKKGLVDLFNDEKGGFHNSQLAKRITGMGVLKGLLVFGTVYRFISPVAVTPVANWIGDKFIHKTNDKTETKTA